MLKPFLILARSLSFTLPFNIYYMSLCLTTICFSFFLTNIFVFIIAFNVFVGLLMPLLLINKRRNLYDLCQDGSEPGELNHPQRHCAFNIHLTHVPMKFVY